MIASGIALPKRAAVVRTRFTARDVRPKALSHPEGSVLAMGKLDLALVADIVDVQAEEETEVVEQCRLERLGGRPPIHQQGPHGRRAFPILRAPL